MADETGWITVREAAARLDVSRDTVLRRLNGGKLVGEKTRSRYGQQWRVRWPPPSELPQDTATSEAPLHRTAAPPSEPTVQQFGGSSEALATAIEKAITAALDRSDERKDAALHEKDERIMELSGQVGFLQAQLEAARDELKLLQPPPENEPEASDSNEPSESATAPASTQKRRWWLLWLR